MDHPCRQTPRLRFGRGRPCLLIEYVNSKAKAALTRGDFRRAGSSPHPLALSFARDIAEGLAGLHAVGLTHRNLKPANILLDENERCIVTDYGLVYDVNENAYVALRDTFKGTLAYAAPELCHSPGEGALKPTQAVDTYALGVILLQALTGNLPIDFAQAQGNIVEIFRLKKSRHLDLGEIRPTLPAQLIDLVNSLSSRYRRRRGCGTPDCEKTRQNRTEHRSWINAVEQFGSSLGGMG